MHVSVRFSILSHLYFKYIFIQVDIQARHKDKLGAEVNEGVSREQAGFRADKQWRLRQSAQGSD